jgi:hypothetical protein
LLLIRLLTVDNRSLLRTIRDSKPLSVAELARLTNRAEPNLLRTLGKLEAYRFLGPSCPHRSRADRCGPPFFCAFHALTVDDGRGRTGFLHFKEEDAPIGEGSNTRV